MQQALSRGTSCGGCSSLNALPPALTVTLFADTEGGHLGASSPHSRVPPPLLLAEQCPWERGVGSSLLGTVPRALWVPTSPGPRLWQSVLRGPGDGAVLGDGNPQGPYHLVQKGHQKQTQCTVHPEQGVDSECYGGSGRAGTRQGHSSYMPSTRPHLRQGPCALSGLLVFRRRRGSRGNAPFSAGSGAGRVGVRGSGRET